MNPSRLPRDVVGSILGILVFLGGIALLVFTFKTAWEMFSVPPHEALNLKPGQPINVNNVGPTLIGQVMRVILLLVMAVVGSLVANRGVHLYYSGRGHKEKPNQGA